MTTTWRVPPITLATGPTEVDAGLLPMVVWVTVCPAAGAEKSSITAADVNVAEKRMAVMVVMDFRISYLP